MTASSALAVERSGPLVSPWLILLVAGLFIAMLVVTSHMAVRRRVPWLAPEAAVLGALGLIHLLFFWQVYRTDARVPKGGGDLASFFYPLHAFAAREVQAGRMPVWNPYLFAGAPHLANFQTAALYPPNLIAYLVARPFEYASLEQLALFHYLIASWGVYWLARSFAIGRPGGVLAGAIFAYSGFMVAHLGHYSMLATAAWAPWVYAAIVAIARRGSWGAALGGSLTLAFAVLGGHQPILLMTLTLAVILSGFELWRQWDFRLRLPAEEGWEWRSLGSAFRSLRAGVSETGVGMSIVRLGFMAGIALLLTAPALGPSFELTGRTVRDGLSYAEASAFSVEPTALVHLVVPTVFGSNPTDYWGPFSNTEVWGYAGVISLLLAAFGVATRRSRTRVFWVVVAALALVYMVGPFASLHGWAYAFIPGFNRIRAAGRAYLFVDLAVAVLAGFGLESLARGRGAWTNRERMSLRWGLFALGGTLGVVVLFIVPLMTSHVLAVNDPGNRPVIALDNLVLLALWLALGFGIGAAAWRGSLRGGPLVFAVVAVVLLDVFHATGPFNPTTDRLLTGFDHPDTIDFLQAREEADGPFRIDVVTPQWQPDLALLAGIDDIGGLFDPLSLSSYERYRTPALADRTSEAYRDLNARYIVADASQGQPAAGYTEAFRSVDGIVLWQAPSWQPRAWIVGSNAALIISRPTPSRVDITLPLGASGQLIVSQSDYPGWHATIDGKDVPIAMFNSALQTIQTPPGAHEVRLEFHPTHRYLWWILALLGVLCWWVVAAWTGLRRWRQRSGRVSSVRSIKGAAT